MSIVSLFCEIDDFFLEYEKCASAHCLPETSAVQTSGASEKPASERGDDVLIAFLYRTFAFLSKTHLRLLPGGVPTPGEYGSCN